MLFKPHLCVGRIILVMFVPLLVFDMLIVNEDLSENVTFVHLLLALSDFLLFHFGFIETALIMKSLLALPVIVGHLPRMV